MAQQRQHEEDPARVLKALSAVNGGSEARVLFLGAFSGRDPDSVHNAELPMTQRENLMSEFVHVVESGPENCRYAAVGGLLALYLHTEGWREARSVILASIQILESAREARGRKAKPPLPTLFGCAVLGLAEPGLELVVEEDGAHRIPILISWINESSVWDRSTAPEWIEQLGRCESIRQHALETFADAPSLVSLWPGPEGGYLDPEKVRHLMSGIAHDVDASRSRGQWADEPEPPGTPPSHSSVTAAPTPSAPAAPGPATEAQRGEMGADANISPPHSTAPVAAETAMPGAARESRVRGSRPTGRGKNTKDHRAAQEARLAEFLFADDLNLVASSPMIEKAIGIAEGTVRYYLNGPITITLKAAVEKRENAKGAGRQGHRQPMPKKSSGE